MLHWVLYRVKSGYRGPLGDASLSTATPQAVKESLRAEVIRLAREAYDRDGALPSCGEIREMAAEVAQGMGVAWTCPSQAWLWDLRRDARAPEAGLVLSGR